MFNVQPPRVIGPLAYLQCGFAKAGLKLSQKVDANIYLSGNISIDNIGDEEHSVTLQKRIGLLEHKTCRNQLYDPSKFERLEVCL